MIWEDKEQLPGAANRQDLSHMTSSPPRTPEKRTHDTHTHTQQAKPSTLFIIQERETNTQRGRERLPVDEDPDPKHLVHLLH